jgi:imidazole glycerol-phosphate synthase subunit HisF
MVRPRLIPVLQMIDERLTKTIRFQLGPYVGDPVNTAKILNDKGADELILVDVRATLEDRSPRIDLIEAITSECTMPVSYGGGVTNIGVMEQLFRAGVEKVTIGAAALDDPRLIRRAAEHFGAQSIVAAVDYSSQGGDALVVSRSARRYHELDPIAWASMAADAGAGEILLTAVDREGTRRGYDCRTLRLVADAVTVPVIAHGGADTLQDAVRAIDAGASAAAAGSMFTLYGRYQTVLVTYPDPATRTAIGLQGGRR